MTHPSAISVLDFTYNLPQEKIAPYPLEKRDESKLLVFKNNTISEDRFKNLHNSLPANSILVFNNTRVVHARLKFTNRSEKTIEVFCLEPHPSYVDLSVAMASRKTVFWNCLVGNLKHWRQEELLLEKNGIELIARISERQAGYQVVHFAWQPGELSFAEVLENFGMIPIPPYFKRDSEEIDEDRYQTVYAKHNGSVAAPTAGLHFTDRVFKSLKKKSVEMLDVTLHVGAGTFMPVKSETMKDHIMHSEWIDVNQKTLKKLAENSSAKVIAVGTTSLRTIESLYWMGVKALGKPSCSLQELEIGQWDAYDLKQVKEEDSLAALLKWMKKNKLERLVCKTQILIAPPYELKLAAGIITNFHQPQSTLLLLISAIVGANWKDIYSYALVNNFRFLSYGDSSLLLK